MPATLRSHYSQKSTAPPLTSHTCYLFFEIESLEGKLINSLLPGIKESGLVGEGVVGQGLPEWLFCNLWEAKSLSPESQRGIRHWARQEGGSDLPRGEVDMCL